MLCDDLRVPKGSWAPAILYDLGLHSWGAQLDGRLRLVVASINANSQGTEGLYPDKTGVAGDCFVYYTHTFTEMQHCGYTDLLMQHFIHYTCKFKATRFTSVHGQVNPKQSFMQLLRSLIWSPQSPVRAFPLKLTSLALLGIGDALKIYIPKSEIVPGHYLLIIAELSI
jgi:hypothetical protein